MKKLTNLFELIQITRTQPQYGYALGGLKKHELSNLAEHHYLVTFIAWQLAKYLELQGVKLDVLKVLEISMVHDIGELFGGDISRHYALANPKARKLAKAFEGENQRFIGNFLDLGRKESKELWQQVREPSNLEGILAKIADIMEPAYYLKYIDKLKSYDHTLLKKVIPKHVAKIKDKLAKKALNDFLNYWFTNFYKKSVTEILFNYNE